MPTDVKRMRYFDGLFLKEEEFNLDQEYHLRIRRLHNRHLHGQGIAHGLTVEVGPSPNEILVQPGMAIDKHYDTDFSEEHGREIFLSRAQVVDLVAAHGPNAEVYVYVSFSEQEADIVPDRGGAEAIHFIEGALIESHADKPDENKFIVLAKVKIVNSEITAGNILIEENGESLRKYVNPEPEPVVVPPPTVIQGGEGKNYVTNPDAETDATGWTAAVSGNLTVGTTTASGDVLSGTTSFQLDSTGGLAANTDYVTVALAIFDREDTNQLMAVELSYKGLANWDNETLRVVIRDTTNNVDIEPNPRFLPGGQGKYRGVFTASNSLTYELRLVSNVSAVAFSVVIDSVRVAPHNTVVGPAISGWIEAGPIQWKATGSTDPIPGTIDYSRLLYRRVGDTMEFTGQYRQTDSGTAGDGLFYVEIPDGYHADGNAVSYASVGGQNWGSFQVHEPSVQGGAGAVQLLDDRRLFFTLVRSTPVTNIAEYFPFESNHSLNFVQGELMISFHGSIPIAEWQSDVVLAESRTEYVYNTSTANTHDTTSFATGEIGGPVPTTSGAVDDVQKRVRLSRVYKHVRLEFQEGGSGPWMDAGSSFPFFVEPQGPDYYGARLRRFSDTELFVQFAHDWARRDGTLQVSWDQENAAGTRWRVVASDNPFFVEAPPVVEPGDVGPWTDAGEIQWRGTGGAGDPTPGPATVNQIRFRRVGDSMEVAGQFYQTAGGGTNVAGNYVIEIPAGLHAAPSSYPTSPIHTGENTWGAAQVHIVGVHSGTGHLQVWDDRHITIVNRIDGGGGVAWLNQNLCNFTSANLLVSFHGTIPIDEWANNDLVLRENLTEYVYNSDTTDGDDTSSFATGEGGGLVPVATTAEKKKRVRFSKPFKHYQLEFQDSGIGPWLPAAGSRFQAILGGGTASVVDKGATLQPVSATEFDVTFYLAGSLLTQSSARPWPTENANGTRWRVVGSDNPLFVESGDIIEAGDVGPWTQAGPIVLKGMTTDPLMGAMEYNYLKYRRVGETMEIEGAYHQTGTGTPGSGVYFIEIPEGLHAVDNGNLYAGLGRNTYGPAQYHQGAAAQMGKAQLADNRRITFMFDSGASGVLGLNDINYNVAAADFTLSFQASIPIDEWTNSDLVLRENLTEYVYNTDTADADDSTSFATGEGGGLVPIMVSTGPNEARRRKRVRFSKPFKHYRLEFNENGDSFWLDAGSSGYGRDIWNANGVIVELGACLERVPGSNLEIDVVFNPEGVHYTDAGGSVQWADENTAGTRWRVVGCDNPLFVESGNIVEAGDVGPWTDAGEIVFSGSQGTPFVAAPSTTVNKIRYRRVGESMEISGLYHQNSAGTPGTGALLIEIPAGLTVAPQAQDVGGALGDNTWGTCQVNEAGVDYSNGTVQIHDSKHLYFSVIANNTPGKSGSVNAGNWNFAHPDFYISFHATVPIDEWANSDLVLRENLTEFVYNTSTSASADQTSFATGESGGLVPNMTYSEAAGTNFVRKRCQTSRPYKHLRLEFNINGDTLWTHGKFGINSQLANNNRITYGAYIEPISPTEFYVIFQAAACYTVDDRGGQAGTNSWDAEHNAGTRWRVVASDNPLFVESGESQPGNVVGPWTDAGAIPFTGTTTDPVPAPTATSQLQYRRVGESMEISGRFNQTTGGTQGSGTFLIEIPAGLNVAANAFETTETADNSHGTAQIHSFGTNKGVGIVQVYDARHFTLSFNTDTNANGLFDSNNWSFAAAPLYFSFYASLPIAEWQGQDVVLSESRVEYVSNSDTANTSDTTSFVSGEEGGLIPNVSGSHGFKSKRVQFSRSFKHIALEIKPNNQGSWIPAAEAGFTIFHDSGIARYGIQIRPVGPTEFDVDFAEDGRSGVQEVAWSTEHNAGTRWRVVGSDNPMFVEAPGAQYLAANGSLATAPAAGGSSQWPALTGNSVLLQPGDWQLNGTAHYWTGGASPNYTVLNTMWCLENGTGTTTPPQNVGSILLAGTTFRDSQPTSVSGGYIPAATCLVRVTAPTEVFLCLLGEFTGTASNTRYWATVYAQRMG